MFYYSFIRLLVTHYYYYNKFFYLILFFVLHHVRCARRTWDTPTFYFTDLCLSVCPFEHLSFLCPYVQTTGRKLCRYMKFGVRTYFDPRFESVHFFDSFSTSFLKSPYMDNYQAKWWRIFNVGSTMVVLFYFYSIELGICPNKQHRTMLYSYLY